MLSLPQDPELQVPAHTSLQRLWLPLPCTPIPSVSGPPHSGWLCYHTHFLQPPPGLSPGCTLASRTELCTKLSCEVTTRAPEHPVTSEGLYSAPWQGLRLHPPEVLGRGRRGMWLRPGKMSPVECTGGLHEHTRHKEGGYHHSHGGLGKGLELPKPVCPETYSFKAIN